MGGLTPINHPRPDQKGKRKSDKGEGQKVNPKNGFQIWIIAKLNELIELISYINSIRVQNRLTDYI